MAHDHWKHRLTKLLDLPGDVMLDMARITMVGNIQMVIENHRGLLEFSAAGVVVGTPKGRLQVTGTELIISVITPETVVLQGQIRGVELL